MGIGVAPSPPAVGDRSDIVQRVAASATFQRSPRLKELLLFICERALQNRTDELHEQQIGCGVFGRKPGYNPAEDNIVRVEVRQLRKRLDEYFSAEGKDEPVLIVIPKGSYVPVFEPRIVSQESAGSLTKSRSRAWMLPAAIATTVVLAAACIFLGRENRRLEQQAATAPLRAQIERSAIWPLLFNEVQQTFIVCADSTLVVAEALLHRSVTLEEYLAGERSSKAGKVSGEAKSLADSLIYNRQRWQFTDMTDARLVQRLYRLNGDHWGKASVQSARTTQTQVFKNGNAVLLGSIRSNLWNSLFEPMLNFRFEYDEQARTAFIRNHAPLAGEPKVYRAARPGESGDSYSVIDLVPNLRHTGSVLIIAGTTAEGTEAAGEFIMNNATSSSLLNRLTQANKGRLPYFEVLLKSGTLAGVAKNAEIVAERILPDEMPRN